MQLFKIVYNNVCIIQRLKVPTYNIQRKSQIFLDAKFFVKGGSIQYFPLKEILDCTSLMLTISCGTGAPPPEFDPPALPLDGLTGSVIRSVPTVEIMAGM